MFYQEQIGVKELFTYYQPLNTIIMLEKVFLQSKKGDFRKFWDFTLNRVPEICELRLTIGDKLMINCRKLVETISIYCT